MTECRFCNEPIHLVGRWWELTEVSGDTYCPYGRECRVHESCPPECSSMTHEPAVVRESEAAAAALEVFWAEVARQYPQAQTGDVVPEVVEALGTAAATAVAMWVAFNVPGCEHGVIRMSCTVCGAR